jgi:hypothetical protein
MPSCKTAEPIPDAKKAPTSMDRSFLIHAHHSPAEASDTNPTPPTGTAPAPEAARDTRKVQNPEAKSTKELAEPANGKSVKNSSNSTTEPAHKADVVSKWGSTSTTVVPASASTSESELAPAATLRAPEPLPPLANIPPIQYPLTATVVPLAPEKSPSATSVPRSMTSQVNQPAATVRTEVKKQPANAIVDPHVMLQQARDLFEARRLDEAEEMARRVEAMPQRWGMFEDSPRKLLDEIHKTRLHAKQEDASAILGEAHRLYRQGQLDEAEKLAHLAETVHGPYGMLEFSERPQTLLTEIAESRAAKQKPQTPATMPTLGGRQVETVDSRAAKEKPQMTAMVPTLGVRQAETAESRAAKEKSQTPAAAPAPGVRQTETADSRAAKEKPHTPVMTPTLGLRQAPPANSVADSAKPAEPRLVEQTAKPAEPRSVAQAAKPVESRVIKEEVVVVPAAGPSDPLIQAMIAAQMATPNDGWKPVQTVKQPEPAKPADNAPSTATVKQAEPTRSWVPAKWLEMVKPAEPKSKEPAKTTTETSATATVVPVSALMPVAGPPSALSAVVEIEASSSLVQAPKPLPAGMSNSISNAPATSKHTDVLPDTLPAATAAIGVGAATAAPPAKTDTTPPAKTDAAPRGTFFCDAGSCWDMACEACSKCFSSVEQMPSLCLMGDVGFSIMRPYFRRDPALLLFAETPGPNNNVQRELDFGLGTQFVPRVSLGVVGCNDLGFRVNWWGFATGDHQAETNTATLFVNAAGPLQLEGGPGDVVTADARLNMSVWDLELTQDWQVCQWTFLLAGGLRFAHIAQRYDAAVVDSTGAFISAIHAGHNFDGVGPTLYFKARRQIGCSGLYVFADTRGSLLVGRTKTSIFRTNPNFEVPSLTDTNDEATSSRMVMPVGELELGLGWRHDWDGLEFFVETAWDGQIWWETGNSSQVLQGISNISGGGDGNLGLMGFTLRFGINY